MIYHFSQKPMYLTTSPSCSGLPSAFRHYFLAQSWKHFLANYLVLLCWDFTNISASNFFLIITYNHQLQPSGSTAKCTTITTKKRKREKLLYLFHGHYVDHHSTSLGETKRKWKIIGGLVIRGLTLDCQEKHFRIQLNTNSMILSFKISFSKCGIRLVSLN